MRVTIRGEPGELRSAMSFAFSAILHAAVLGWVVVGASLFTREKPQSIYDQEIRPQQSHIVWYGIRNRLPDVTPVAPKTAVRPPRAVRQFQQHIVSGAREDAKAPQTILAPIPEIRLTRPLPLPNVLAVAAVPRPVRAFVPPSEKHISLPAPPKLPEAPQAAIAAPARKLSLDLPPAKAPLLPFHPPPEVKRAATALPEVPAPKLSPPAPARNLSLDLPPAKAPALPFRPPPEVKRASPRRADLPAPPAIAEAAPRFDMPRVPKGFTAPEARRRPATPALEVAPPPEVPPAPAVKPTLVIAGLAPVEAPKIPTPPGSHEAGFSAAPKVRPEGGDTDSKQASLTAPSLMTRGGPKEAEAALIASLASPTSRESLMEGMRQMRAEHPQLAAADPGAPRVTETPDPRLAGRAVYRVAIQMPNITSYSGSWLVWFALREALPGAGAIESPVPLHKVDPKYIAAARDEHVEGTVRLFAIIRKTGQVDSVELLKHLDDRLDRSAAEALLKWQFQPARCGGIPVDVDAVFEIPFHLAPRTER